MNWYHKERKESAVEALSRAQKIAYSPMEFQAARLLCKFGILADIETHGETGRTLAEVSTSTSVSEYGVDVLLSMGLSARLVYKNDNRFIITKTGYFLLNDEMTRINMSFTHDVCYQAMYHLEESIKQGRPVGLKEFGSWDNIYQGLTKLPEDTLKSWLKFDHFYSDGAFPEALPLVFADKPKTLFDVGGNTGKWSLACAHYDDQVQISILELPEQLALAQQNIMEAGFSDRVKGVKINLLDHNDLFLGQADAIWMSQFLDCFAPDEIISILTRATAAMNANSNLFIMETLWDRQKYEAASYSLNAISLYFTAIANGNSRMYSQEQLISLIHNSGLQVVQQTDGLGFCHSLFKCRLARKSKLYQDI